jgi:hypothetical protein
MLVSVWAVIVTHYSNINEQESEGTEHSSVFSLYRCRICESTLEEILMNSHPFSMLQKYSGKCCTSPKLHVCFLFIAWNGKFQNAFFFIFLSFLVDLNVVCTMWFCYLYFLLLYTKNRCHSVCQQRLFITRTSQHLHWRYLQHLPCQCRLCLS